MWCVGLAPFKAAEFASSILVISLFHKNIAYL
jgi:hypothetical protein